MLSVEFDTEEIDAQLDAIVATAQGAARAAAQAGAEVYYEEVLQRVPISKKGHWFHGTSFKLNGTKYWYNSGALIRSIYQVYSKDNSTPEHAEYHIAWNHKKAPYGFMVEMGTSKVPAHPFLRPAFDAKEKAAVAAANAVYAFTLKDFLE